MQGCEGCWQELMCVMQELLGQHQIAGTLESGAWSCACTSLYFLSGGYPTCLGCTGPQVAPSSCT
eukprot:1161785-Pelagomonas_calceolata.AAC.5